MNWLDFLAFQGTLKSLLQQGEVQVQNSVIKALASAAATSPGTSSSGLKRNPPLCLSYCGVLSR